jgi:hypothetical protein
MRTHVRIPIGGREAKSPARHTVPGGSAEQAGELLDPFIDEALGRK